MKTIILTVILMLSTIGTASANHNHNHNRYNGYNGRNDFAIGAISGLAVGTMLGYRANQPRYERVYPYYAPMHVRQPICQNYTETVVNNGYFYEYPRTACLNDFNEWIVVR